MAKAIIVAGFLLENWQLWKHESKDEGIHLPNQMTIGGLWWETLGIDTFFRVFYKHRHINHPLIFTELNQATPRMPNTWFPWPTYHQGVTYVIIL